MGEVPRQACRSIALSHRIPMPGFLEKLLANLYKELYDDIVKYDCFQLTGYLFSEDFLKVKPIQKLN